LHFQIFIILSANVSNVDTRLNAQKKSLDGLEELKLELLKKKDEHRVLDEEDDKELYDSD
jgi:hypothetical protein